ncbi:efflux RND transporter periplasmic adaptor subunit [Ramlibacter sp. AW1]|uniref:Efflux RND transporter periplasmic adaptor subunit n=1 Tax=Ramlibacter aurantiacus TaxID=2801330 RepID=A0A936ZHS2_9BURK|nr:efflux RND transporter periplasmic adaptor subunit [Ramlibacter aurantiacus]MBL0421674.1 efflux RND transporter periplasmic adaptor subunit [Ramlibacter aurantiacus]
MHARRACLLPIAAAMVLLSACGDPAKHAAVPPTPAPPVMDGSRLSFEPGHPQLKQLNVVAAQAARPQLIELPARLVWNEDRTQRIQPALAGRVDRIAVDVGQPVQRGTVLAQLASPDFGIAQSETAKARVDVAYHEKSVQRLSELFEAGVVARKELEQAQAEAARAQAEMQRAQARSRLYGGGSGVDQRLAIVAGLTGVVMERHVTPGQELRADGSAPPLFVISDPTSLWVQIDARETDVDALRMGAEFQLVVPVLGGETFRGIVTAVADAIDPTSRTIKVRGIVANPKRRLKAEMLGTARIERAAGQAVVVPASAVQLRGTSHWVMVQPAPGVFEPREVKAGWLGPKEVGIVQGLQAGEQVVTENLLLLSRQYTQAQEAARETRAPGAEAISAGKLKQGDTP